MSEAYETLQTVNKIKHLIDNYDQSFFTYVLSLINTPTSAAKLPAEFLSIAIPDMYGNPSYLNLLDQYIEQAAKLVYIKDEINTDTDTVSGIHQAMEELLQSGKEAYKDWMIRMNDAKLESSNSIQWLSSFTSSIEVVGQIMTKQSFRDHNYLFMTTAEVLARIFVACPNAVLAVVDKLCNTTQFGYISKELDFHHPYMNFVEYGKSVAWRCNVTGICESIEHGRIIDSSLAHILAAEFAYINRKLNIEDSSFNDPKNADSVLFVMCIIQLYIDASVASHVAHDSQPIAPAFWYAAKQEDLPSIEDRAKDFMKFLGMTFDAKSACTCTEQLEYMLHVWEGDNFKNPRVKRATNIAYPRVYAQDCMDQIFDKTDMDEGTLVVRLLIRSLTGTHDDAGDPLKLRHAVYGKRYLLMYLVHRAIQQLCYRDLDKTFAYVGETYDKAAHQPSGVATVIGKVWRRIIFDQD